MGDNTERSSTIPWPPIVYLVAVAVAVILSVVYPLGWLPSPLAELAFAAGIVVMAGAIAIQFTAIRALRRANTTISPVKRSEHMVTDGSFSFTRNPIYLGNTMLVIGVGLIFAALWFFPAAFCAAFATTKLAIEREEKHLEHRFGKSFRDYRKRVRRWI